jgi:uncharacterized membrane-anchored protein YitT (DUF2179 family)
MAFPDDQVAWLLDNKPRVLRYIHGLQVIVGVVLMALGFYMGHTHFHLIRAGIRTQGRIIAYHQEQFPRSGSQTLRSTGYMPVVEYRVGDQSVQFQDWLGTRVAGTINLPVTVLYEAANPSLAMIDRPIWNWLPWAPIEAVGLLLLLSGITGLLRVSN